MSTVPMILSPPSQKIIELQFIVTLYLKNHISLLCIGFILYSKEKNSRVFIYGFHSLPPHIYMLHLLRHIKISLFL